MRLLILTLAFTLSACERFKDPPRPPGVPEGAERDRRSGLWSLRTDKEWSFYYADGKPYANGPLVNQGREGLWRFYGLDGKTVLSQGMCHLDFRDGTWNYNDERGQLFLSMVYAPEPKRAMIALLTHDYGNENGTYRRYYPDGKLEEEGVFQAGYYEGPVTRFHPNGKKLLTGRYQQDLMVGRWLYYYPNGTLLREENYNQGALDGRLKAYYPDGSPYMESTYSSGKLVGSPQIFKKRSRG